MCYRIVATKLLLMTFHYTQHSSEKLLIITYGNKCRDPQLDNVQIVRNLRTFSSKWGISNKSLPSRFRETRRKRGRNILGVKG